MVQCVHRMVTIRMLARLGYLYPPDSTWRGIMESLNVLAKGTVSWPQLIGSPSPCSTAWTFQQIPL